MANACRSFSCNSWTHYSNRIQKRIQKTKEKKENKSESTYRPVYHFSTPDKWKNDPQKPIYFDGKYHYYYLYNHDYPKGTGRNGDMQRLKIWFIGKMKE